jgi:hypothetical protein
MSGHILCIHLLFQSLMKYLQDESLDKRKVPFRASEWQTKNVQVCHFETYVRAIQKLTSVYFRQLMLERGALSSHMRNSVT